MTVDDLPDRLVAAALDLLDGGGVDAVTVRAVAARAGTSTQGVYTCFGGRGGLLAAVRDLLHDQLDRRVAPAATVRGALDEVRAFARSRPAAWRALHDEGRTVVDDAGAPGALRRLTADERGVDPVAVWLLARGAVALELEGHAPTSVSRALDALWRGGSEDR